jgi:hypothetical protein
MDEQDASLFDGLSADQLAFLEEELREKLSIYLKHVVGLAGAYEHVGDHRSRTPKRPFCYTATVFEVGDQWYLVTAGHNLEKMDAAITRPDMQLVACGLDDTFAPGAKTSCQLSASTM